MSDAVVTLAVVITLSVGPAAQPRLCEQPVLDLALLLELDLAFEYVDLARQIDRRAISEAFFPGRQCRGCPLVAVGAP